MADSFAFVETDSAKIYTTVIGKLMDECDEALYPGDERRIFGEALVAVLVGVYNEFNDKMKQRTLRYARGRVLDALGERLGVERLVPSAASAVFQFSASTAMMADILIPAGTRITTDGSVYFATREPTILHSGDTHVEAEAVCTVGGSEYNGYAPGMIATLVDLIPYISGAINITPTVGGDDGEPYTEEGDNRLRERIHLAPSALSTAGSESAYRYFVLSADPDIIDVSIDCPEDQPNTVNIYPLMKDGALPTSETIKKILEKLSNDVRPLTDFVQVFEPTESDYDIKIKYYCTKEQESATIESIEGADGAIAQYNKWQTSMLGRDINPDQLRRFLFAPVNGTGALRAEIKSPEFKELSKWEIARFSGNLSVTHEVIKE